MYHLHETLLQRKYMNIITNNKTLLLSISLIFLLNSCAMVPPKEPVHEKMIVLKAYKKELSNSDEQWWLDFQDEQLNQLLNIASKENFTLKKAQQSIDLSKQQVLLAKSNQKLKVGLNASAGVIGVDSSRNNAQTSGLGLLIPAFSYQFDFWGKNEAMVSSASNQQLASIAQAKQAKFSIFVSLTTYYFQLQNNFYLENIYQNLLQEQEKQNIIMKKSFQRGLAKKTDILQNTAYVNELKATLSNIKNEKVLIQNQIALLLGKQPKDLKPLFKPNAKVITTLKEVKYIPMNLLARRYDVIASKWMVESYKDEIKVSKTEYYPNFNLMLQGLWQGLTNLEPSSLALGGLTVATTLPIYDGGVRDANYKSTNIAFDNAVTNYNETIVKAAKQVSDAVTNLQEAQKQIQYTQVSVRNYKNAYEIINKRYKRGLSNYVAMNQARTKWQEQLIRQANNKTQLLNSQLQLIYSLGGGYHKKSEEK